MSDATCAVRLTRRYRATLDEVWEALLAGGWLGAGGPQVRVVEPRRVAEVDVGGSVARIELSLDGDDTVLVLDHPGMAAPAGMRAMRLWTRALERLEVVL